MSLPSPPRLFRKRRLRRYARRGEIYAWLRTYQDLVATALARSEVTWADLIQHMALDGVEGRDGAALSPNAALKVCQRVCRDVADQGGPVPPRRKPPSKISPNWRPQEVMPSPPSAADAAAGKSYDPPEQIARLLGVVAERSGRKP